MLQIVTKAELKRVEKETKIKHLTSLTVDKFPVRTCALGGGLVRKVDGAYPPHFNVYVLVRIHLFSIFPLIIN